MSLFANAQKVEAPKSKSKASAAVERPMTGMERYAAIDAAMKALKGMLEVEGAAIKSNMNKIFVEEGMAIKRKPANFKGVEGAAKGSCELRKRSSTSPLTAEELALLKEYDLPTEETVKTEEAFLINPAYTHNMELLAKVEDALADVDLPDDFLLKQDKESVIVVNDETVDKLFAIKEQEAVTALLPLVTVPAIKATLDGDFWAILDTLFNPESEEAAE